MGAVLNEGGWAAHGRRALGGVLFAMAVSLAGCDGAPAVLGPGGRLVGVGGGATVASSVAGTWRRTLFFLDDQGFAHSSETTWEFNADGSALRTVVTRNLTLFLADASLVVARWQVVGTQVVLDFVSPSPGRVTYDFRFDGARLVLAGETYARVED